MSGTDLPNRQASIELAKALAVLLVFALAVRGWAFTSPAINNDEQFYLVAGQQLLEGKLLYVDIWDRKPIGLFLIYAVICRVFSDPIVGYHVVATAFALATALVLFRMARRFASFGSALAGAAAYLAWLNLFGGIGGQAPVIYNLPMALAAAMTLALATGGTDRQLTRLGCVIMLLSGAAIQIKYTCMFEGIFFGLSLLWTGWQRGRCLPRLALDAAVWIACALAPTALAFAAYAATGHTAEFIFANFASVMKDHDDFVHSLGRLAQLIAALIPFFVCTVLVMRGRRREDRANDKRAVETWVLGWAAASFAAFLFYGVWLDFYALPLLAPFCLIAVMTFERAANRRTAIAAMIGLGLLAGTVREAIKAQRRGSGAEVAEIAGRIAPHLGSGCLYVNEKLPILYLLTHSCLPTRFVFPDHLTWDRYRDSLGVDQVGEMRRLLAARPAVVLVDLNPELDSNPVAMRQMLMNELNRHYRLDSLAQAGTDRFAIYVRTPS